MFIRKIILLIFWSIGLTVLAQFNSKSYQKKEKDHHFSSDSIETEGVPEGIYAWKIDPRFGTIIPTAFDTIPHLFPNESYTDGMHGHYNYLGNLGSPRITRIVTDHHFTTFKDGQFLFTSPYSYFIKEPGDYLFTNTKSPFTNLTYHESGNKVNGEDHFKALFAVNVNKRLGFGFKFDYIYGRGYYFNQSTSQMNTTLYGTYLSNHYNVQAYYSNNFIKTRENGGLQNDRYLTHPEDFKTSVGTRDIPVRLTRTFNRMHLNTFYLTHRYNIGFTRFRNSKNEIVKIQKDKVSDRFEKIAHTDSIKTTDSTKADSTGLLTRKDSTEIKEKLKAEFIPVLGLIHTLRIDKNSRRFLCNDDINTAQNYFKNFYLPGKQGNDLYDYTHVSNLFALEISEGFSRWVPTGMRLFAAYDFYRYTLPKKTDENKASIIPIGTYHDHYLRAGGELYREKGHIFRYHALGELRSNGKNWGEFNIEGNVDFNIPFKKDSLSIKLMGFVRNEQPSFYYRHYHGRNAWWDKNLDNTFSIRAGGTVRYKTTELGLHVQNIRKLPYLVCLMYPIQKVDKNYLYGVDVRQKNGMLQTIAATVRQDLHWGIFHWENEITFQTTTDQEVYPVPAINVWSNMFLKFTFAKVLHTEIGGDIRYFTPYYAPIYMPSVGLFAVQGQTIHTDGRTGTDGRMKLGNYPIINVYANFMLKRTRFYVAASHVNFAKGAGNPFLVPHYALNPFIIRFGVSWNFIN